MYLAACLISRPTLLILAWTRHFIAPTFIPLATIWYEAHTTFVFSNAVLLQAKLPLESKAGAMPRASPTGVMNWQVGVSILTLSELIPDGRELN